METFWTKKAFSKQVFNSFLTIPGAFHSKALLILVPLSVAIVTRESNNIIYYKRAQRRCAADAKQN